MATRSHHGCERCKRRRQRCDEAKPTCGRCQQAATTCVYSVVLKWSGRVPRGDRQPKTRQQLLPHPVTHDIETSYGNIVQPFTATQADSLRYVQEATFPRELDILDRFSTTDRLLLHHFVTQTSMIASNTQLREQTCKQILPMALHIPSLLYATIALSSIHYFALINGLPPRYAPEAQVSKLINASLRHLRQELHTRNDITKHQLLHTIRTLCVCEIYSGKADSSWRVHALGARAIIDPVWLRSASFDSNQDWLSSRWYQSIEALSALTELGLTTFVDRSDDLQTLSDHVTEDYVFDIYAGYSSDLNTVFRKIAELVQQRQLLSVMNNEYFLAMETDLESAAHSLESTVRGMIQRDEENGLKLPPGVALRGNEFLQFSASNTVYQHCALIFIYRKVRLLESTASEVQESVRTILDVLCSIKPVYAPSPWALLTTPIFVAGCEAIDNDRAIVKETLLELYRILRIRNILRALEILEAQWGEKAQAPAMSGVIDFIPF